MGVLTFIRRVPFIESSSGCNVLRRFTKGWAGVSCLRVNIPPGVYKNVWFIFIFYGTALDPANETVKKYWYLLKFHFNFVVFQGQDPTRF
jgi:hypothetical protein